MIILAHSLFGAAMGHIIGNPIIAIILAVSGHYFLDFLPHIEYTIENISKKQWQKTMPEFMLVALDICLGLAFISIFSSNKPIIYICAGFAIMPDILSFLSKLISIKLLSLHNFIHQEKIHLLKHKKIPKFWRIFSQVIIVILSVLLLKI